MQDQVMTDEAKQLLELKVCDWKPVAGEFALKQMAQLADEALGNDFSVGAMVTTMDVRDEVSVVVFWDICLSEPTPSMILWVGGELHGRMFVRSDGH